MKQLVINLSQNELLLSQFVFPKDFDIKSLPVGGIGRLNLLKGLEKTESSIPDFLRKAIGLSHLVFVDPTTFSRKGEGEANKITGGKRRSIPLGDDEWYTLHKRQQEYFPDEPLSTTVVWAMYNLSKMVTEDPRVLRRVKREKALGANNTRLISVRLPVDLYNALMLEVQVQDVTLGYWVREKIKEALGREI